MKVIVTGILGQDGSNMAEFLLNNTDHQVYGMMRRAAVPNYDNIKEFKDNPRFHLHFLDLSDGTSIDKVVQEIQPDYFINFAANSFVGISWKMPEQVFDVNALGVLRCLEAIKKFKPDCRFYSAGSSEEWGDIMYSPQDMFHPMRARSPYGASKIAARQLVKVYRESYDMYAVHGILFNHEGPRRGEEFVTRKITKGVARIKKAIDTGQPFKPIELGNLDAKRDWSDSRDFVRGIWLMVNRKKPKDYLLASGKMHSVREFVDKALEIVDIKSFWSRPSNKPFEGYEECIINIHDPQKHGYCGTTMNGDVLVRVNKDFFRPAEVEELCGDSDPARIELGWEPEISFEQMVKDMIDRDLSLA